MAGLLQDVRFALRQLRKSPGYTITAVLMLALAICANSTVYSWINGTMLHPIPGARDPGELVSVMRGARSTSPSPPFSYLDYRDLRDRNRSFDGMIAYHHEWITLTGGANPERIYLANVSSNFFDVLGIKPALGRFFLPREEVLEGGGIPYVVLSYSLWQTRFVGDPSIVGKSIEIARTPVTVIGVAPQGFLGAMPGLHQDAWAPINPGGNDGKMKLRSVYWLNVVGRLQPGVNRQSATEDLETIMRQIVAAYPNDHLGVNTISLDPMWRSPFGANIYMAASLPILLGIACVVLLLTCANVATLALVRFVSRRREIAIRQSLGASRAQIIRQMIIESLLVCLGGGAAAVLATVWTAKMFGYFVPPNPTPIAVNGVLDNNVIVIVVLLAAAASLICGALPAWRSSRVPTAEILKEESGSVSGSTHNRHLLSSLVVVQIALSLALLISSGLFLRTLRNLKDSDPGFERDHVLTASVGLSYSGYSSRDIDTIRHRILDNALVMRGVTGAALTDWVPYNLNRKTVDTYPEGYAPQPHESLEVRRADVTAGYFATLGIPILEGRDFTHDDTGAAPPVVIVDQAAAHRYWPGQDPLGRRLTIFGQLFTVVGVVKNTKHQFMNEPLEPMIYLSYFQEPDWETTIQIKTKGDPQALAPALEEMIHQIDGQLPVFDVRPLSETAKLANIFVVIEATLATGFGFLALVLAATGIYGVVAYRTKLRTHEIGIRVALGASRADVLKLVLMQGLMLTIAGLILGLALALGLTRFVSGLLYGIGANDPFTAGMVVALLAGIALLACYIPAYRATRADPVSSIREQ